MGAFPDVLYATLRSDLATAVGSDTFASLQKCPEIPPDATFREAAAFSINRSFLKKFEVENSDLLDDVAYRKFLSVDLGCKNWRLQIDSSIDEVVLNEVKHVLYHFLEFERAERGPNLLGDSLIEIAHHGRLGPGSSIGARGGDFYTKLFDSPLTCTSPTLYQVYRGYTKMFPEWSNAEIIRQEHHGSPRIVQGNRLSFVPKNDQTSRTICVEPSLNMFFQLGLGQLIERRLAKNWGVSLSSQPFKNRELARLGSIDDSLVTIDLSSASDSISLEMLRWLLPRWFVGVLELLRSRFCETPDGQLELGMVSTMGNGFTFPLETMIFSGVVLGVANAYGVKLRMPRGADSGNWGVFGDDIICPAEIAEPVIRTLHILGFSVNKDKTFVKGPFRESCGGDFFRGRELRGFYLKRVGKPQDRFAAINQLNLFSTKTGIQLPGTVQELLKRVPLDEVPRWENDDSGVKVPQCLLRRDHPVCKHTGSMLYWAHRPVTQRLRIGETAIFAPKAAKRRLYNPSGLWISFLQRSINASAIGVRHDSCSYKRKLGVAPFWDATPNGHPLAGWFNWQRWDTAVYLNHFG